MLNKYFFKWCVYYPAVVLKGAKVFSRLEQLRQLQYESLDNIENRQEQDLISIVDYASQNVPFYKGLRVSSLDDLKLLPFLQKEDIRSHRDSLMSKNNYRNLTKKTTGGSTGIPMHLFKTAEAREYYLASLWRGYEWAGVSIGNKRAHFWGSARDVGGSLKKRAYIFLSDKINNRRRFSAFAFDDSDLEKYYKIIVNYKPEFFYGYASMISEFAKYLHKNNLKMTYDVRSIVTTAEPLTEERRSIIEKTFGTKVYDEYGCGEVGTIAHECQYGNKHINAENLIVEIVDDNGRRCPDGTIGHIVLTELHNKAMPLLRYRIGDLGAICQSHCECGRHLPILVGPMGRLWDQLITQNGKKYNGTYYTYELIRNSSEKDLGIMQYQLEQISPIEFVIRLVINESFSDESKHVLKSGLKRDFGENIDVNFEFLNDIPRLPSGKIQLVKGIKEVQT